VQAERNGYIRGVVKEIVHDSGRGEYPIRELDIWTISNEFVNRRSSRQGQLP
jgi:hypothetical protein